MHYRIRYREAVGCRERETTVEANSPTEALVKFRCTLDTPPPAGRQVQSVSRDEAEPVGEW